MGHTYRTWAFAAAAVLLLRHNAQGQTWLAHGENKHGQGTAWTLLAHQVARAVDAMLTRATVLQMAIVRNGDGRRAGEPAAALDTHGLSRHNRPWKLCKLCGRERAQGQRRSPLIPRD
jgi:hypothetical protein